jgi:hypothetical protein
VTLNTHCGCTHAVHVDSILQPTDDQILELAQGISNQAVIVTLPMKAPI